MRPNPLRAAIEAVREPQDFESGDAPYRADLLGYAAKARRLADLAEGTQMWVAEAFRLAQLAGWSAFGTHIGKPTIELEFSGQDEDSLPLWERPKGLESAQYSPCPYVGSVTSEPCIMPAGHDDGIHDRARDTAEPGQTTPATDDGTSN